MLDNHGIKWAHAKPRPQSRLRKMQNQLRDHITIGTLGDVGYKLPDAVAEWLCTETLRLPPVGGAKLPAVSSLIALICIDAYHDDLDEAAARKGKRND